MHPLANTPNLWRHCFPWPTAEGNKYHRGHAIVVGGGWASTGAAILAARAALRVGAGLVSIACDTCTLPLYAAHLEAVMTKLTDSPAAFAALLADAHVRAVLVGPGAGVTEETRARVHAALAAAKPTVLDADALTVFADAPADLFAAIHAPTLLTPHDGEFARLFARVLDVNADHLASTMEAARVSGATVIRKGSTTLIAAPDGRVVSNPHATPFLATAGSGDVLAGIATGLLAQAMPAFEAACAAVWLHAESARRFGPGLTAEDIAVGLPPILSALH